MTHIDFRDNLLFGRVSVSGIDETYSIRLFSLQTGYCRPQDTFATSSSIASKVKSSVFIAAFPLIKQSIPVWMEQSNENLVVNRKAQLG